MYRHPIIGDLINRIWFSDGQDSDGVQLAEQFNLRGEGLSFELISLTIGVVSHDI
jgi:hypothetical protein